MMSINSKGRESVTSMLLTIGHAYLWRAEFALQKYCIYFKTSLSNLTIHFCLDGPLLSAFRFSFIVDPSVSQNRETRRRG